MSLSRATLPPGEIVIYDGTNHMHPKGYTVQNTYFDFCTLDDISYYLMMLMLLLFFQMSAVKE